MKASESAILALRSSACPDGLQSMPFRSAGSEGSKPPPRPPSNIHPVVVDTSKTNCVYGRDCSPCHQRKRSPGSTWPVVLKHTMAYTIHSGGVIRCHGSAEVGSSVMVVEGPVDLATRAQEILSKAVDDGRKNAAYPWCVVSTGFQRGKGYATWTRVQHPRRF